MAEKLKTLFMGSGEFAVNSLIALSSDPTIEIVGVVTQPDKPAGRKKVLTPTPIKKAALELKLPLFQPEKLKLEQDKILKHTNPEIIIVADYGQILSLAIIDYPKYKCINIHASLLPKYRGAVPIEAAILNGDRTTGITIMLMSPGLDDGPILVQEELSIDNSDTGASLTKKLSELGAKMIVPAIKSWVAGEISPMKQNEVDATFAPKTDLGKEKAKLNFDDELASVLRKVRGFYPWPVAWINVERNGLKRLKILEVELVDNQPNKLEDFGFKRAGKELHLLFAKGTLKLNRLQLEGMKEGTAQDYLFLAS